MDQYKLTKQKNSLFSFGYVEKGTGTAFGKKCLEESIGLRIFSAGGLSLRKFLVLCSGRAAADNYVRLIKTESFIY